MKSSKLSTTTRIGLLLFGILLLFGCLKEGTHVNGLDDIRLVVVPSAMEVGLGDTVNFDILLLGEIVEADLYIDNSKISGHEYIFRAPGIYKVHAQKEGVKNSDTLEINIAPVSGRKLFIRASGTEIMVGEDVSFTAGYVNVEPIMVNADFYVDGVKIPGDRYKFEERGTYTVIAKKEPYQDSDPLTIIVTDNTLAVYVSGFEENGTSSKAKLWKNNASNATTLGDGVATDIFSFHGDIYLSGYIEDYENEVYGAKYWKNTTETTLKSGKAKANSILVEEGDGMVFIAGSVGSGAVYWQDESIQNLASDNGVETIVNDMAYDEGNIYAVGYVQFNNEGVAATIWALGDRWGLYHDDASYASAIVLKDGDYYVAGGVVNDYWFNAVFWKSGNIHSLSTPDGHGSMANDIAVKDNNIYVAGRFTNGFERENAVVWINNKMTILNNSNEFGLANAIAAASDGTIFVAGWTSSTSYSNRTAVYWHVDESGNVLKRVNLTDGNNNAEATGISLGN